ncbi:MAG: hypothetical protein ACI8QP_001403 [Porticoccaceae bacterium]|jgi:hypothetical protein
MKSNKNNVVQNTDKSLMMSKKIVNNNICSLQQNRGSKRYENKNIIISTEVDNFDITFLPF